MRLELIGVLHELTARHAPIETRLSEYVETVLHEIHVAQYLEMHGLWPDGVPLINEHGEFSTDYVHGGHGYAHGGHGYAHGDAYGAHGYAHGDAYGVHGGAHGYQTYGHHGYMSNAAEDVKKAADTTADPTDDQSLTININGPVILVGGDASTDVAALLQQALQPSAASAMMSL